jgi:hypothetical protein
MQRFAMDIARQLHTQFFVSVVAYLDDWLIFGQSVPATRIQQYLEDIGFTITRKKSVLSPTQKLTYLGLRISILQQQPTPTAQCLQHLAELITTVLQASRQDLLRITGYSAWLAWAINLQWD